MNREDDTVDLLYDDGDFESHVPRERLHAVSIELTDRHARSQPARTPCLPPRPLTTCPSSGGHACSPSQPPTAPCCPSQPLTALYSPLTAPYCPLTPPYTPLLTPYWPLTEPEPEPEPEEDLGPPARKPGSYTFDASGAAEEVCETHL